MRHVQRQIFVYGSGQRGMESNLCVDMEGWNHIIDK